LEWEQIYAELLNKIRWSIASTASGVFNYSYTETVALAGVCAGDVLKLMKLKEEKPDLRFTSDGVRELIRNSA